MKIDNLSINEYTIKELERYKHEILFYVTDSLENNPNPIVKETLLLMSSEQLYSHLEHHQMILLNFCKLKNVNLLKNHILWTTRVLFHNEIDLNFSIIEYDVWKEAYKRYMSKNKYIELEKVYDWIINNYDEIKKEALKPIKDDNNPIVNELYKCAVKSDLEAAIKICEPYCDSLENFNNFFSTIISNTMLKIGQMWEINKIDVAKEHIASSLIEELSLYFLQMFNNEEVKHSVVLLATSPNEYHALGIKVIGNILKKNGYKVINLGANTPKEGIVSAINTFKVDYLALSITLASNLHIVIDLIKEIRDIPQYKNLKIIIGGYALENIEDPVRLMGVDFYSRDLNEIIDFINSMELK